MPSIKDNIAIFQAGKKESLPVIFVHGFPYDHSMWNNQIEEFKSEYYCVSYDIRGLGNSTAGDGQYTLESMVDDLEEIIEYTGIVKPVLCGLSMGGYISLRAIERMENKFRGLVLSDTKSQADTNDAKLNRAAGIKKINAEGVENFTEDFIKNCFTLEFIEKHNEVYTEIVKNSSNFDPAGLKGCLLAMAGRTDTTEYLSQIEIPVLVLCGEEDKLTTPDVMMSLSGSIHGAEFFTIPKAAHMSPVENHRVFNKHLKDFLTKNFG